MDEEEQVESWQCTVEPCTIQRGGGLFVGNQNFPGEDMVIKPQLFHYSV